MTPDQANAHQQELAAHADRIMAIKFLIAAVVIVALMAAIGVAWSYLMDRLYDRARLRCIEEGQWHAYGLTQPHQERSHGHRSPSRRVDQEVPGGH